MKTDPTCPLSPAGVSRVPVTECTYTATLNKAVRYAGIATPANSYMSPSQRGTECARSKAQAGQFHSTRAWQTRADLTLVRR